MKTGFYKATGYASCFMPFPYNKPIKFPIIGYVGIGVEDGVETFYFIGDDGDKRKVSTSDFIFANEPLTLIEIDEDTRYEIKNITENINLKPPFDQLIYTHSEDDNTIRIWKSNLDRNNITLQKFVNEIYTQTK